MYQSTVIHCPYCGEQIELPVDPSAGNHRLIEDCQVCCKPIELNIRITASGLEVDAKRDDA